MIYFGKSLIKFFVSFGTFALDRVDLVEVEVVFGFVFGLLDGLFVGGDDNEAIKLLGCEKRSYKIK